MDLKIFCRYDFSFDVPVQVFSLYIFKQIVAANPFAKDSL